MYMQFHSDLIWFDLIWSIDRSIDCFILRSWWFRKFSRHASFHERISKWMKMKSEWKWEMNELLDGTKIEEMKTILWKSFDENRMIDGIKKWRYFDCEKKERDIWMVTFDHKSGWLKIRRMETKLRHGFIFEMIWGIEANFWRNDIVGWDINWLMRYEFDETRKLKWRVLWNRKKNKKFQSEIEPPSSEGHALVLAIVPLKQSRVLMALFFNFQYIVWDFVKQIHQYDYEFCLLFNEWMYLWCCFGKLIHMWNEEWNLVEWEGTRWN
jgi:hypothetical protein